MKYIFFILLSVMLALVFGVSEAFAQSKSPIFSDTVLKIKEDDDGKLIVLKKASQILYLKYSTPNFDSVFTAIDNSQTFGSNIKITTDANLNVLKAE